MNSTSFFYAHTDQWRYEKLGMDEMLSPLADRRPWTRRRHDRLQRAGRAHGLAALAPQLKTNPLRVAKAAERPDVDPKTCSPCRTKGR